MAYISECQSVCCTSHSRQTRLIQIITSPASVKTSSPMADPIPKPVSITRPVQPILNRPAPNNYSGINTGCWNIRRGLIN